MTNPNLSGTATSAGAQHQHQKMLARVRALLAKAESTTFPAEAEALTAKAQQIMAEYAIDQALVRGVGSDQPERLELVIESPYVSAKCSLLAEVAGANRCRLVWQRGAGSGHCTVFGYPADLEVTELLFTSLLVQASVAMAAAGADPAAARERTRGFRRSFLLAFAHRIGQRLREANEESVATATRSRGSAVVPVLARRDREVEQALREVFPLVRKVRQSAGDMSGWSAGRAAADRASLGTRRRLRP